MNKLVLALLVAAAFTGSAVAADLPARTYVKTPPPVAPLASWSGCYVAGGGGYGLWNQDNTGFDIAVPRTQGTDTSTTGGRGYFGTLQAGCDHQFAAIGDQFVVGAFGDYDFSDLKGRLNHPGSGSVGDEKMSSAWSVGGRVGWLALPNLLTYFSAGYTEATFDRTNFAGIGGPPFGPTVAFQDKKTYRGYFIGAGNEYALGFFPGLFWKTEYRFSEFNTENLPFRDSVTGALLGGSNDSKKWVQTVRSELVYRFNWPGSNATPTYVKAPPPAAPVVNWTGCYVGGGGGYGLWNQENTTFADGPPRTQVTGTTTTGGRGYFGTVQGGCDYQLAALGTNFVVGAFGDYDFSSLKGRHSNDFFGTVGDEKMSSAWAAGGRAGWLVAPKLLTYFSAGYTEATFDRQDYTVIGVPLGIASGLFVDKRTYKGWFVGAGDEYALGFLPGLFWKTEYRFSQFDTEINPFRSTATGLSSGFSDDSRKWVHTVRSELVYRFNWAGPVIAKY